MHALPLLLTLALAPPEEPGAFALLEQSRRAYQELAAYGDTGEIAVESAGGGEGRYRFETRYRPDRWSYVLERLGSTSPEVIEPPAVWTLWRDEGGVFLYDGRSDAYRAVASADAGLVEMLGVERRAAALVAIQLLAAGDLLESPLAASVAGTTACGPRRCFTVDVSPAGAGPDLRLHLDADTHLIRGVEITIDPIAALAVGGDVAAALRDARSRPRRAGGPTRIVVHYEPAADPAGAAATPYSPPSTARLEPGLPPSLDRALETFPGASTAAAGSTQEEALASTPVGEGARAHGDVGTPDRAPGRVFAEEIEVRLTTVTVRVIDASGRAIPDLGPADFAVRVGHRPAQVESVDWIAPSSQRFSRDELAELARSGVTVPPTGRLIVIFVQTDLHPTRTPGHLRLLPEMEKLLATLDPEDEVAVVSFDSHLKLRQDFTRDLARVQDAVARGIRVGREPALEPGPFPSLARHFDFDAARRAATPERALRLVGEALLPLPGEKVLVFAGWGLGSLFGGVVRMTPEYRETREALTRARVTVFVLDVTRADYHSLEVGLETIAEDTGGTYEKTFQQPAQMTERLAHALEGYYEIAFSVPEPEARQGKVSVDLVGRRGQVLLRPTRLGG
jgi:VWFA-related protein